MLRNFEQKGYKGPNIFWDINKHIFSSYIDCPTIRIGVIKIPPEVGDNVLNGISLLHLLVVSGNNVYYKNSSQSVMRTGGNKD